MSDDRAGFPATERWLSSIKVDRRTAYNERIAKRGLKRVSVTVPVECAEFVKAFGEFLRNVDPELLAEYREDLEQYQADCWAQYDEAVAAGRFDPNAND